MNDHNMAPNNANGWPTLRLRSVRLCRKLPAIDLSSICVATDETSEVFRDFGSLQLRIRTLPGRLSVGQA